MRPVAKIIFIAIILLMCVAPLTLFVFGVNTPDFEKRPLAAAPNLISSPGKLNGEYTSELDGYIADHFPLRTWLISSWHNLNISLFGQSGNSQVILGKDGWLFFAESVPSYLGHDAFSDAEYARLETILRLQAEYLAAKNIHFLFTVAPNKNTVYPDMMPARYKDATGRNTLALMSDKIDTADYLDLRSLLRGQAAQDPALLYHRTDSHWNNRGARLALEQILARANVLTGLTLESPFLAADYQEVADWQGDLAVMLFPSGPAPDIQQYYDVKTSYRYARALKSLEDMLITTRNADGAGNLLMFRDSFANALIPMLSQSFAQVTYSRAVPYDYSLLDKNPADLVLIEIVERNLHNWLVTPPRMLAIALSAAEEVKSEGAPVFTGDAAAAGQPALEASVRQDQGWLQISGQLSGLSEAANWTRILVRLGSAQYEAFPVTLEKTGSAGFVLYLEPGQWPAGDSAIEVMVQAGSKWTTVQSALPVLSQTAG
jgi:hypothetical protein